MNEELGHGPRLTDEEYDRKVVELYRGLPPVPTREQDTRIRRQELELAIDHRLGKDFPRDRRDALWVIQQRVERRRKRLMFRHLVRSLLPGGVSRGANRLAGYLVDEYAKELNQAELKSFFGEE
jgi:hypothetical protein